MSFKLFISYEKQRDVTSTLNIRSGLCNENVFSNLENNNWLNHYRRDWGSPAGIATRYGPEGPGIESRWGSGYHPASCAIRTDSLARGYRRWVVELTTLPI